MLIDLLLIDPKSYFITVALTILAITCHELAHGWAAISQGDTTPEDEERLTPNPLVHMGWASLTLLCLTGICWGYMPIDPASFRNGKVSMMIVCAAGPCANLVLAVFAAILHRRCIMLNVGDSLMATITLSAVWINGILFVVNMLPVPPLDGFQVYVELFPALRCIDHPYVFNAVSAVMVIIGIILHMTVMADFISYPGRWVVGRAIF